MLNLLNDFLLNQLVDVPAIDQNEAVSVGLVDIEGRTKYFPLVLLDYLFHVFGDSVAVEVIRDVADLQDSLPLEGRRRGVGYELGQFLSFDEIIYFLEDLHQLD